MKQRTRISAAGLVGVRMGGMRCVTLFVDLSGSLITTCNELGRAICSSVFRIIYNSTMAQMAASVLVEQGLQLLCDGRSHESERAQARALFHQAMELGDLDGQALYARCLGVGWGGHTGTEQGFKSAVCLLWFPTHVCTSILLSWQIMTWPSSMRAMPPSKVKEGQLLL